MARQKTKICVSCNHLFRGRQDAKTCSEKCRKRLQRAQSIIEQDVSSVINAGKALIYHAEERIYPYATEGGYIGDSAPATLDNNIALRDTSPIVRQMPAVDGSSPQSSVSSVPTIPVIPPPAPAIPAPVAPSVPVVIPSALDISSGPSGSQSFSPIDTVSPVSAGRSNLADSNSLEYGPMQSSSLSQTVYTPTVAENSTGPTAPVESLSETVGTGVVTSDNSKRTIQTQARFSSGKLPRVTFPYWAKSAIALTLVVSIVAIGTYLLGNQNAQNEASSQTGANVATTQDLLPSGDNVLSLHFNKAVVIDQGASFTATGESAFKNLTNSETAFNVQNTSGDKLINVDTITGLVTITGLQGSGALLTDISASNITSGTVSAARLPAGLTLAGNTFNGALQLVQLGADGKLTALDASKLINVNATTLQGNDAAYYTNASNIATGTLSDLRLSTNVCLVSGNCVGIGGQIVGTGTSGSIAIFSGSGTIADSILTQSGSTVTSSGNINATGQYQIGGVQIASSNLSDTSNLAKLNGTGPQIFTGNNRFTGTVLAQNAADSTTAFQIQKADSTPLLIVDTTAGTVTVTGLSGSGANLTSLNGTNISSGTVADARLSANVALLNGTGPQTFAGNNKFTGTVLLENTSNSTGAFQVQNSSGIELLTVNTTGSQVTFGKASALTGNITFYNASATGSIALVPSDPGSSNYTLTLPSASGTVCLTTGNCAGSGTGVTTSGGSINSLAKFSASQAIVNSNISDDGTTVNVASSALFKNGSDSSSAFLVQNAAGNNIFSVDTSTGTASLGKLSTLTGNLTFYNASGSGSVSIAAANPAAGTYAITLPAASGTVCLTSGNCAGVGGTGDILNNGNSLGSAVTIGANDNYGLNLETNGTTVASLSNTGAALFKNSSDGTTAFRIQNSAGNDYLLVNTSGASLSLGDTGTANTLQIGNTTGVVTQTINIGNNTTAFSRTNVAVGSAIGASQTDIKFGTNGFSLNGGNGSINISTDGISRSVNIGGGTSSITLDGAGSSAIILNAQPNATIKVADGGTNTTTVQIGNSGGALSQTINIGTNAHASAATSLTLGGTGGTSSTAIQAGSGGINLLSPAMTTIDRTGGGTALQVGNAGVNSAYVQKFASLGGGAELEIAANGDFNIGISGRASSLEILQSTSDIVLDPGNVWNVGVGVAPSTGFQVAKQSLFKNSTNSTTGFQIQNSSSSSLFNVDTLNGQISINQIASGYSDEFGSGDHSRWSFVTNDSSTADINSSVAGKLYIDPNPDSGAHDCWTGGSPTCLREVQTAPSRDFMAETKLDTKPGNASQALGIIIYKDTTNFIRYEWNGNGDLGVHKVIANSGTSNVLQYSTAIASTPAYLRVNRVGDTWYFSYSSNGTTWANLGNMSQALDLSVGTAKIGIALSNGSGSFANATIDYFRLTVPLTTIGQIAIQQNDVNATNANSLTAFSVKNSDGAPLLTADTVNFTVNVGTTAGNGTLNVNGNQLIRGNSSTAFRVQNASAANFIAVDTVGSSVTLGYTSGALTLQAGSTGILAQATSSTALVIQKADGTGTILTADTSSATITLGSAGATPVILVLGNKNTSGDPAGSEGAVYYNSSYKMFRCYHDGAWASCTTPEIDRGYLFQEEFLGGTTTDGSIGENSWDVIPISSGGCNGSDTTSVLQNDGTGPDVSNDRPGIVRCVLSVTQNRGAAMQIGQGSNPGQVIGVGTTFKTATAVSHTANIVHRVGLYPGGSSANQPVSGVWWEFSPGTIGGGSADTHWQYCYGDGSAAHCAASTATVSANTFARLSVRVTAIGTNTSAATFAVDGTEYTVSSVTIDSTVKQRPAVMIYHDNTTQQSFYIDYFQTTGISTAAR